MKQTKLTLKACGSFYLRAGWLEKALKVAEAHGADAFSNKNGVYYLGVGANMVPAIRFWAKAANIIDSKSQITEFGRIIIDLDQYFEHPITWWFIHYFLATNEEKCPVFYYMMNEYPENRFFRSSAFEEMRDFLKTNVEPSLNDSSLDSDFKTFLSTYIMTDRRMIETPEDNLYCPLSKFSLFDEKDNLCVRKIPSYGMLPDLFVYYVLRRSIPEEYFTIDEALNVVDGVGKILNLDRNALFHYLDDLRRRGLVTLNRTAGLNIIYFNEKNIPDFYQIMKTCIDEEENSNEIF